MNPALIAAIIGLIQEAIAIEPAIAAELQSIFSLENPTPADWEALRQKVLAKSYADYVPTSALAGTVSAAVATPGTLETPPISQPGAMPQVSQVKPEAAPYLADGSKNPAHVD